MENMNCPKCGAKIAYFRVGSKDYRCGNCDITFFLGSKAQEKEKIQEEKEIQEETREKEPTLKTIEMSKEDAQKEWEAYRDVLHTRKEKYIANLYSCLSQMRRGRKIIDVFEVIKEAGVNEKEQPKLAIVRADVGTAYFFARKEGAGKFSHSNYKGSYAKSDISLPKGTFPEWKLRGKENDPYWWDAIKTKVPIVPAQFLPKGSLEGYHVLWEVDDWEIVPTDPILLKRITDNLFAVLGVWDLTPLEQAIVKSR